MSLSYVSSQWAKLNINVRGALGFAMLILGVGCTQETVLEKSPQKKGTLIVSAWEGYFPEFLRERFEQESGYKIEFAYLPSDSELFEYFEEDKWTEIPSPPIERAPHLLRKPHLIMPAAFTAKALHDGKHIQNFDQSLFPDGLLPLQNGSTYNPSFDPDNSFVIPYTWGATGIAYDAERVDGLPASWSALFSGEPRPPEPIESWGFRPIENIALLDDARFTLGSVLLYQNKSPNTTDRKDVFEAANLLVHLRLLYLSNTEKKKYYRVDLEEKRMPELLREGKIGLSMTWSADVTAAMHELRISETDTQAERVLPGNSRIRIALPQEGSILFRDSFIVPAGLDEDTLHAVHQLIEFMLHPRVAAAITNDSFYATTVETAHPYVERFIFNGPSYFKHPTGQNRFLNDVGAEMRGVYQEAWDNVKNNKLWIEDPPEVKVDLPEGPEIVSPDLD